MLRTWEWWEERGEDPVLRNLRLNLLALAKRAPLRYDRSITKGLVPEHIRHFVPTLAVVVTALQVFFQRGH